MTRQSRINVEVKLNQMALIGMIGRVAADPQVAAAIRNNVRRAMDDLIMVSQYMIMINLVSGESMQAIKDEVDSLYEYYGGAFTTLFLVYYLKECWNTAHHVDGHSAKECMDQARQDFKNLDMDYGITLHLMKAGIYKWPENDGGS